MSISERIREVREHFCKSNLEFARLMNTKPNVTSNWINRNAGPRVAMMILEKFPQVNTNWLLTGEGDMLSQSNDKGVVKAHTQVHKSNNNTHNKRVNSDEVKPVPYDNYMMVEYADLSTSAGLLGRVLPEYLPETKRKLMPKEFDSGNYLVVKIDGDSMDDGSNMSIPDGSEILIREYFLSRGEKLPIRNNLFVIVSQEGTVFKQITEHNMEEGYIRCHSYNPKYKDYTIPLEEILQIFIYRKIVSLRPCIPEI